MLHRLTRQLSYSAGALFDLVGDVESYPRFVPWISELRAWNRRQDGEGVSVLDAEAKVKFAFLRERFATRVRLDRPRLGIDVALLSGPFRRLENHWRFEPNARGTELVFDIDFEFRSHLLDGLLAVNFERAAARLVDCFERRAAELYGGDVWKRPTGS
ncbi:MAG TPA: SRPBCC family protein [Caulobacteraceae bacterium]